MRSEITKLMNKSRGFFKKHKSEIVDIVVFGSIMRGKENPSDIDVLIVFKNEVNKNIEYEFKRLFSNINLQIISKTEAGVKEQSFSARDSILFEGYSLIRRIYLADEKGYTSLGLFSYQTRNLSNVQKTKFYYAFNGRNSAGFAKELNCIKISDNLISVNLEYIEKAKGFFEYWKIDYRYVPCLIPERMAKKHILGKVIESN